MKASVVALLLSCLAFSQARFIDDDLELEDSEVDLYDPLDGVRDLDLDHHHHHGHCHCCSHGCWCHGQDGGLMVSVTMQVDETEQSPNVHVVAFINVGKAYFSKKFEVNKLEDFCETVNGEEFCFDFDIKGKCTRYKKLYGCVKLTKPKPVTLGCFRLPYLSTEYDVTGYDEIDMEDEDSVLYFE